MDTVFIVRDVKEGNVFAAFDTWTNAQRWIYHHARVVSGEPYPHEDFKEVVAMYEIFTVPFQPIT